jgi:DNA-binding MarR family transcriptional regulator
VNHSADKPIAAGSIDQDQLLDQFEAVLYRIARIMAPSHDQAPGSLSPPQYLVLRLLEKAGPMRVSEVAGQMGVKSPAASMMLNAMYENGLVDREQDPDDRRATLVSVSERGETALHEAEKTRREFMRQVTGELDSEEWGTVIRGLNTIADAAHTQLGLSSAEGHGDETEPPRAQPTDR